MPSPRTGRPTNRKQARHLTVDADYMAKMSRAMQLYETDPLAAEIATRADELFKLLLQLRDKRAAEENDSSGHLASRG